jgi:pimeloyl-ACP methyl ester carboxylesterase
MTAVDVAGEGPPLVLIHGFPLDRSMWWDFSSLLVGWRCVAPDLRGFGMARVEAADCSITTYATDLVCLMDLMDIDGAVVCGFSLGGYVAFELLRRHQDRVRGLILLNTRAAPDSATGRIGRDTMIKAVQEGGPPAVADEMLSKLFAPGAAGRIPDQVTRVRQMIINKQPAGIIGALSAMRARPDSHPLLSSIGAPTLVVAGADDQLIPITETRAMAAKIPRCRLRVIPDSGHLSPIEQPQLTVDVVAGFLAELC